MQLPEKLSLDINIIYEEPIDLQDVEQLRSKLKVAGIYFIIKSVSRPDLAKFNPCGQGVVYIGKAISETIYSRTRKHLATIRNTPTPKTRPGKRFKTYREEQDFNASNHWVIAGMMEKNKGFEISYAEEYLIAEYQTANEGDPPRANTAHHKVIYKDS
jgi:hypothetical protein